MGHPYDPTDSHHHRYYFKLRWPRRTYQDAPTRPHLPLAHWHIHIRDSQALKIQSAKLRHNGHKPLRCMFSPRPIIFFPRFLKHTYMSSMNVRTYVLPLCTVFAINEQVRLTLRVFLVPRIRQARCRAIDRPLMRGVHRTLDTQLPLCCKCKYWRWCESQQESKAICDFANREVKWGPGRDDVNSVDDDAVINFESRVRL